MVLILITRPRILMKCHLFFWYVTNNIRVYTNSVYYPLDIGMYTLCAIFGLFCHFGVLGLFVCCVIFVIKICN
jgi:hypothetical protein